MVTKERIMKDLECCMGNWQSQKCTKCSYYDTARDTCIHLLLKDVHQLISTSDFIEERILNKLRRTRKDILELAEKCVCGQREEDYGTPEDNFKLIAELWTPVIRMCVSPDADVCVLPEAVALMMALVKVARLINNPEHLDSWVDLAGYAACGGEIAGGGHGA